MPEIHLRQPGLTYSACGPLTKNKGRIKKFKEARDQNYIYKNKLGKVCFQHEVVYGGFKDLARRTSSDKILRDKFFNIANNPKYDGSQRGLASLVYKFFDKMFSGSGVNTHQNKSALNNEQFAEELHKPIIRKFWKGTVYSGLCS